MGSFRKYAEADLIELRRINHLVTQDRKISKIDFQTAVSMFEGHSLFSIFESSVKLHEEILEQIQ